MRAFLKWRQHDIFETVPTNIFSWFCRSCCDAKIDVCKPIAIIVHLVATET